MKNRDLISKLLVSTVIANDGSLTLRDLEGYLDDCVCSNDLLVQFQDKQIIWKEFEENLDSHKESFHSVVEKISDLNSNSIRIEFDIRCETCGGNLEKIVGTDQDKKQFRCRTCMLTHTFTITSSTEVDTTGDDSVTVF